MIPHKIMHDEMFSGSGWLLTGIATYFNLLNWLAEINVNQVLTVLISLVSLGFVILKAYYQLLLIKEKKRKLDGNK